MAQCKRIQKNLYGKNKTGTLQSQGASLFFILLHHGITAERPSQVAQRNASLRRNTAKVVVICSEGQPGIRFGYGAPGRDIESILAVRLGRGSLELCSASGAVVSEGQTALTQNRQDFID